MAEKVSTQANDAKTETSEPNLDNVVGVSVLGVDYIVDLDELTADLLRETLDTTGRSEIQIVIDLNSQPGRLSLANFLWLATRSAGKWITFDSAFKLANTAAMRSSQPLLGDGLRKAYLEAQEAHPQS